MNADRTSVLENLGSAMTSKLVTWMAMERPISWCSTASNDVSVFLCNPDGSLRPHQRYGIGNTPQFGTIADFDGDGRIDVAAAIGLPPSGLHNAIVLLRNVGGAPQPTPTPTPTATATPTSTRRRLQRHVHQPRPARYSDSDRDAQLYAHGNAEAYSDRKTKGYAQAEADTFSSA